MAEIRPSASWVGRTLGELALRSDKGINVIAIKDGDELNAMPRHDTVIRAGDRLLVVAANATLSQL